MAQGRRQEWARRVARWKRSGKTAAAFALEEGLNVHTLRWWNGRLDSLQGETREVELVPLQITQSEALSSRNASIEITTERGHVVRVRAGVDAATLRTVLAVLDEGGAR